MCSCGRRNWTRGRSSRRRGSSVPCIVNDNVEVAVVCGADGVHVGQEDLEAGEVRRRIGEDMLLGVSVHTVEEAC